MLEKIEENPYDSMIENGTSEDDSDMEDHGNAATSGSDDGFSAHEEEPKRTVSAAREKGGGGGAAGAAAGSKRRPDAKPTVAENAAKKVKIQTHEKVKPPTLEEINELKETRNLFHSNLLRLQVKEMLAELHVKEKYTNYISAWLEQFKGFLRGLANATDKADTMDKMDWLQRSRLVAPIDLAQLRVREQKPFQFQFYKPTAEPYLIGAAATQTLLGPQLVADVCVPMPAACFSKDNYLNLVYEQKRAYYLTYIANEMLRSTQFAGTPADSLKFTYHANDPLKPVLVVTPTNANASISKKLSIRIFVAGEEASFKLNRFVPWNSNVRASLFDGGGAPEDALPLATPHYNAGVLFDLTMQRNQQLLHETFGTHKNFQEGLVLLKVWLQQRQLQFGFSGLHAHTLAMYIAYLFKQRKLHANMSSYQVARNVWTQLAHSTWDENNKGITLCPKVGEAQQASPPTLEQFHTYYDVVFIDVTGYYNICANLSAEMYRRVRLEAKLAVDMLNDMKLNSFQLIFMVKRPLYTQFDHILKIHKADVIDQILEMHVAPADKLNFAGYAYPQLLKVITGLLRKGLGERVDTILPIEQPVAAWPCTEAAPACAEYVQLGMSLNPTHAYEVLDKGPESIAEGADEFRKFWGEKAQLRRFQDGTITESVVWATAGDTLMTKRLIVRSIVLHLLQQHFQVEPHDVEYVAGDFDVVYKLSSAFKTDKLKYPVAQESDAEALSLEVIRAFDDLARKLHALSDLPLEIVSIAGISPVFRYCEPTPILPLARCINDQMHAPQVPRAVIQLGLSGKWPSELTALRALKSAFYIQIAQMLRAKHRGVHTRVTHDGVLVLQRGYCFAFELAHPKEVALLKREKTERGITQYVDCPASVDLERRHYILPKVSGALHALYQVQPSFGAATMIAKRWLYSQLIDDGIWPAECTELLVASLFLHGSVQQVSCSPQTIFVRFLHLLAHTDWKTQLFFINFNQAMDENELSTLEQRFHAERETFPPLCIATAYDQKHCGQLWTSLEQPNVHVLARVTLLARQALSIVESSLLSPAKFIKPSKIFIAPSQGYDLVIQLKPDMVMNTYALDFGSPFVAFTRPNWRLPLADTNFVQRVVQMLREAYSDYAFFFYNPCGGKEIAVIWKPAEIFAAKEFKVTDVNGCSLSSTDASRVECRKETLVEDFKFLLKDCYVRVDSVEAVRLASQADSTLPTDRQPVAKGAKATQRYFAHTKATDETPPPKSVTKLKVKPKVVQQASELPLKALKAKPAKAKKLKAKVASNANKQSNKVTTKAAKKSGPAKTKRKT